MWKFWEYSRILPAYVATSACVILLMLSSLDRINSPPPVVAGASPLPLPFLVAVMLGTGVLMTLRQLDNRILELERKLKEHEGE